MSKTKKIVLFLFLFLISFTAKSQRSKDLLPINYFKTGEYAKYKIIYKFSEAWVSAGHVTFELEERMLHGKVHMAAYAKGNTAPAFDLFYKVRDEYATVFDPEKMIPKLFLRRVNEGGFRIYNDLTFNHDSLYVNADVEDSKSPRANNNYTILPNTQDIVSAIYYCRTLNYSAIDSGAMYQFPFFIDNEVHNVAIKYLGKTNITTEYGEFKCIILQPTLLTGRVFDQADQMRIYVTDDAMRIPVYIESPLKVGKVIAVLTKYTSK